MHECDVCGKEFETEFALNGHKKLSQDLAHQQARKKTETSLQTVQNPLQEETIQYTGDLREGIQRIIEDQRTGQSLKQDLKELLMQDRVLSKKQIENIQDEYYKNIIIPQFEEEGPWMTKEDCESKIKSERNQLAYSYQEKIENLKDQNDILYNKNIEANNHIISLTNYIDNSLDNAVRRERTLLQHDISLFTTENTKFNIYRGRETKILEDAALDNYNKSEEIEQQNEVLKKREEAVNKREKKVEEQNRKMITEITEKVQENKQILQKIQQTGLKIKKDNEELEKKRENIRIEEENLNITKEEIYDLRIFKSERKGGHMLGMLQQS